MIFLEECTFNIRTEPTINMTVIVNSSIHDGTVFYCASKILKNLAAEDVSDSESKINDGQ